MRSRVVITSDGKRGHENQSRVLARMLGDLEPLVMLLRGNVSELPLRMRIVLSGLSWLTAKRAERITRRMLVPETPALFKQFAEEFPAEHSTTRYFSVSAGTQAATLNLVLAQLLRAVPLVIMTPSLLKREMFALNIVPDHDLSQAVRLPPNVIASELALSYHDVASASNLAARLATQYGLSSERNYLAVAIGGPTRNAPWINSKLIGHLKSLLEYAQQGSLEILLTTSRRTPTWCTAWLAEHYVSHPNVAYYLDASQNPLNPLPAFYELSRAIVVTDDSHSMVCEAIQAGHKPLLINCGDPAHGRQGAAFLRSDKVQRSMAALRIAGRVADWPPPGSSAVNPLALAERSSPNQDYEKLKAAVRQHLELDES